MQFYGIETFNRPSGKAVGKGMDPDVMKGLLLEMKKYMNTNLGLYRGTMSLIAGLPHETIDSIRATQQWAVDNWNDQNWLWWNLGIAIKEESISAFGLNLEKYGYKVMTLEEIAKYSNVEYYGPDPKVPQILWKNQNTDAIECERIVEEFNRRDLYLDVDSTSRYLALFNKDYNKVLSIRKPGAVLSYADTFEYRKLSLKLAKNYISKKLG